MTAKKKKNKSKKKSIKVQIIECTPSGFYIQDLDKIEPSEIEQRDLEFRLNIVSSTNIDEKLIKVELELDSYLIIDGEADTQGLFGIKSTSIFKTPEIDDIVNDDGKVTAPDEFMKKLLNISIGGIRGMLAAKLVNTEMRHITLPLLDLSLMKKEDN
ncbi:hypothetical protein [Flagellimonas hadalis]|nr:hypothetical protein [Allomuricauda hadalis]